MNTGAEENIGDTPIHFIFTIIIILVMIVCMCVSGVKK
jgi:hypothetical protein